MCEKAQGERQKAKTIAPYAFTSCKFHRSNEDRTITLRPEPLAFHLILYEQRNFKCTAFTLPVARHSYSG